jgi:hypothetical protein
MVKSPHACANYLKRTDAKGWTCSSSLGEPAATPLWGPALKFPTARPQFVMSLLRDSIRRAGRRSAGCAQAVRFECPGYAVEQDAVAGAVGPAALEPDSDSLESDADADQYDPDAPQLANSRHIGQVPHLVLIRIRKVDRKQFRPS